MPRKPALKLNLNVNSDLVHEAPDIETKDDNELAGTPLFLSALSELQNGFASKAYQKNEDESTIVHRSEKSSARRTSGALRPTELLNTIESPPTTMKKVEDIGIVPVPAPSLPSLSSIDVSSGRSSEEHNYGNFGYMEGSALGSSGNFGNPQALMPLFDQHNVMYSLQHQQSSQLNHNMYTLTNQQGKLLITNNPVINDEPQLHMKHSSGSKKDASNHYACQVHGCGKVFARFYNLKSHMRTHTGVRPFVCEICETSFSRSHDLKRHRRIHSGVKPYVCENCQKSFSRLDALNRHVGTVCQGPKAIPNQLNTQQQQQMAYDHNMQLPQEKGFNPLVSSGNFQCYNNQHGEIYPNQQLFPTSHNQDFIYHNNTHYQSKDVTLTVAKIPSISDFTNPTPKTSPTGDRFSISDIFQK